MYYVPGTVLGSGEQQGTKQKEISVPIGLTFWRGGHIRQDKISQFRPCWKMTVPWKNKTWKEAGNKGLTDVRVIRTL